MPGPDPGAAADERKPGGPDSGPNLNRLARGGALNLVGAGVAGVQGLALVFIVAHLYSQRIAGTFFAATSLFIILQAVSGLGTDAGLLRWVPRHLALGDRDAARRTVPVALVPVVATAAAGGLALALTAPWTAGHIGAGDPGQAVDMVRVLALFLPLAGAHDALLAATRGHGSMRPTVLVDKILRQTLQVAGVVAAALVADDAVWLALAWAAPYLPCLVVAALWYLKISRAGRATATAGAPPAAAGWRPLAGGFWRFTAPRAFAQICQTAFQRADIVLVAALSSPREAAVYTAATRFIVISQLVTQAVQNVMQPAVSRLMALADHAGAQRIFAVCASWNLALAWPVHLSIAVGAPVYVGSFGAGYRGTGEVVTVILAMAMLVATATGARDVMLLMAGRSGLSLVNQSTALGVNLVLNVLLIPPFGIAGAAMARACGLLVRTLLALVQVRRILGMSPASAGLFWAGGSALVSFAALPLAVRLVAGSSPAALAGALVPGAILYFALLWAGRERLALTAFASLLPGRRGRAASASAGAPAPPATDTTPARSVHAHGN
ncbi:polysaccharide biosynthesis C-terminal domain-containing protein [Actinomadura madurae]|uniref:polysaccharide biosynthesis C-terminal domain-containing protein n=1 Tax=Actinomadura madurae TaxID=1993 RepID=UPI002026D097|nr:polysaccharide biosynthesis C-terminal domain-containing protein [Actinomadura madurae]URM95851.1 polysaccharide biosynthesis C-terminal domain-containing protein [Actinomadura madurae]